VYLLLQILRTIHLRKFENAIRHFFIALLHDVTR